MRSRILEGSVLVSSAFHGYSGNSHILTFGAWPRVIFLLFMYYGFGLLNATIHTFVTSIRVETYDSSTAYD